MNAFARSDAELLDEVPSFLTFGTLAKATAAQDGGERIIYFEASNQDVDLQAEVILQKALMESAGYYLRHGNIDLGHYTIMGPKSGIPNHLEYEIGRPLEVVPRGTSTFVKGRLYQGEGAMARNADMVWDSLTRQTPPARWYASVGGAVLSKSVRFDPVSKQRVAVVDRVRWNNVALDRTPVNGTVPVISTSAPQGLFAKALGGWLIKGLEAGAQVSPEGLTGGGALRVQSIDHRPQSYFDFRERMAGDIRKRRLAPTPAGLIQHARDTHGLAPDEAAEWSERFLADLDRGRTTKEPAHVRA